MAVEIKNSIEHVHTNLQQAMERSVSSGEQCTQVETILKGATGMWNIFLNKFSV